MDHDDEFLNTFFTQLTQLCFDKAKETERERETCKLMQMGPWGMLLMHLPQIIVAERSYTDIGFLHTKNKGFLRKDNSLRTTYESLRGDLKRVEEMSLGTSSIGTTVADIASQLCQFITARIQLIDFYEKMYAMSNSKVMHHQELLLLIGEIIESHSLSCLHLAFNTIKAALTLECEILMQLMKAYIEIENWRFLPSLMALYGVQVRISAWERTIQNKETWKLGFGKTFLKANQQPALFQWLVKLRCAILAKFSLYFHTALNLQTMAGEMRSIMSKHSVDYYQKLLHFQKKFDIFLIALVFDSRDVQNFGPGYRHPHKFTDDQEDFPIAMSIPQIYSQKPAIHWDNIRKNIEKRYADLIVMDKIIFASGQNDIWTYAMFNVDQRMTLSMVYENCSKPKDKNNYVITFITDICLQMRCNKVFESLKLVK